MKKTLIISVLLLLFAMNSMALNAPTLSSPNNNLENCYSRIAFSWSSVSGASYVLEVDTCPEFNSALLRHISVTSTSRTEYNFLYGTTYYWTIFIQGRILSGAVVLVHHRIYFSLIPFLLSIRECYRA